MTRFFSAIVLFGGLALSGQAFSQSADASGASSEELRFLFSQQESFGGKTRSLTAKKKEVTRGLVVAPVGSGNAASTDVAYVEYEAVDQNLAINFQIKFDFDSDVLRGDQKPKLANLCQAMQNVNVELFRIVGHTDASGAGEYNDRLSLARALGVKQHLVSGCGIEEARLQAIGAGERALFNTRDPRADENRRVEFQVAK